MNVITSKCPEVPVVQPHDDQRRRAVPAVPGQEAPAFLWVRYRCGHYEKATQENALWLLSAARSMKCNRCR